MKQSRQQHTRCRLAIQLMALGTLAFPGMTTAQDAGLSIREIMTAIIAPMTSTLWGAYEIKTDAEWQNLGNAALTVVAAGSLLKSSGEHGAEADWQAYSEQMIAAARAAMLAIENKNEEALSNAGNDLLYPPCESCHQRYLSQ